MVIVTIRLSPPSEDTVGNIVTVTFRGAELYGFAREDTVFVALKPIVDAMVLDWSAQLKRVKRDPILAEGMAMMATPFGRGAGQEAVCLRLDLVNGWLFTIDSTRIRDDEVRERVLAYQRDCYRVLADHFTGDGRAPGLEPDPRSEESVAIRRALVAEARQTFDVRAARELWFRLGLPVVPAMSRPGPLQGSLFDRTHTAPEQDAA